MMLVYPENTKSDRKLYEIEPATGDNMGITILESIGKYYIEMFA